MEGISKGQKRKILSEDEYDSTLNEIIGRDYYPDIRPLERQVRLNERRAVGDVLGAVAIRREARLHEMQEEQVLEQERGLEESGTTRSVARPLNRESLTAFHARVTSEDNAEFAKAQVEELAVRSRTREEQYLAIKDDTRNRAEPPTALLLASDEFNPTPHHPSHQSSNVISNPLFFVPGRPDQQTKTDLKLLTNSGTNSLGDNSERTLMPPPKSSLVEYIPKNRIEKSIEPIATRFPSKALSMRVPIQHLEGSGEDTDTSAYATDGTTDIDEDIDLDRARRRKQQRRTREQESYVTMTPLIVPNGNSSPITTWGNVYSTPLRAESSSPETPADERQAIEDIARANMERRLHQARGNRPKIRKSTPRPESVRSRSSFGTALRASYGSSARSSRSCNSVLSRQATPRIHHSQQAKADPIANSTGTNRTDGLLKLPK